MSNVPKHSEASLGYFSAREARDRFMERLHALEPDCFAFLLSKKGLELAAIAQDHFMGAIRQGGTGGEAYWEAEQAKREHIAQWQRRWHLVAVPEHVSKQDQNVPKWRRTSQSERERWRGSSLDYSWITEIADATLREYVISQKYGEPVPVAFVASTFSERPSWEIDLTFDGQPVNVDLKAHSLSPYLVTDEGWPLLRWNPRTEPRFKARERLMMMLDSALDRIEQKTPSVSILDQHFDWLIRFQVMGQNQELIADDVGRRREQVNKAINTIAVFIGLEPRKGNAGRPPRKTGRTVRVK